MTTALSKTGRDVLRSDIARGLTAAVEGEVRLGLHDRLLYATDASIYQVEPLGVVIPSSIEDVCRAVRYCDTHGVAILPRGGGTSLAGQCTSRAVVLDLSAACLAIADLDEHNASVHAEAGVTIDDLNDTVSHTGLFFAPDPSTSRHATVGGSIGNNAAGSHSIMYGRTAENLLGVDVCLMDGQRATLDAGAAMRDPIAAGLTKRVADVVLPLAPVIRERFPKTLRRNAGYAFDMLLDQLEAGGGSFEHVNLAHLICGSEGTLAMTLGATLKLHPAPKAKGLAVVAFGELDEAMDALLGILETQPAAVELLDDLVIDLARKNLQHRGAVELLPKPSDGAAVKAVHYVEYFGQSGQEVEEKLSIVRGMFPASQLQTHTEPAAMAKAWALRKAGEPLLHGIPGERKPLGFVEDNAVPPERLAEFVRGFRAIVEREGTRAAFYAHASVGVLHVRPLLSLRDAEDRGRMERIAGDVAVLAKSLGGVMSGEHGDGRARGPLLESFYGPEIMEGFRAVKRIFDPKGLLNPGNIVDPRAIETIHADTRVTPGERDAGIGPVETFFDYADQTDFAHAVEMCNGAGVCRKKTGGVMCPSYMATLDERHSTRGRGNALRLAISGQMSIGEDGPAPAWDDEETLATLDLCLSCKACKSECPSNVDVARLKAEYHAQKHEHTGRVPFRSMVFGHIHLLSTIAGIAPGVTNFANTFGPARAVLNRVLGLHAERSLPRFEKPLHARWGESSAVAGSPRVALYADTFTTYNEPGVGLAAKRVLEAFGYSVWLHRGRDASRAMLSVGMVPQAIRSAERELSLLAPIINDDQVKAILFVEPSVLSAVLDEWLLLKINDPEGLREKLAQKALLVEDFLDRAWEEHPGREGVLPSFTPPEGDIVVHGHCHQKALWGAGSSSRLLERLFPGKVRTLDTTCCGMAGSFGYTAERFGLSMKIGELGLLPAARALKEGDVLVAAGTSCRHQVWDGGPATAVHPTVAVASLLATGRG